ncbi:MAG TPA: hypothetical protein PKJ41_18160 [Bryobacteraceae bacterium]|nr:hypothetical protein [Bryobacteraceae bacterium]HPT25160.1 hypothetical protein [Bryobacteraceae bacterium]
MEERVISSIVPVIALVSGLIAAYVSIQSRALLAEVRREIAEMENRLFVRINGTYVRAGECRLREEVLETRIRMLVGQPGKKETAG